MLRKSDIFNTIWFDIETTTRWNTFDVYSLNEPSLAKQWAYRSSIKYPNLDPSFTYSEYGMLYPEHSQVIAITVYHYDSDKKKWLNETMSFPSFELSMEAKDPIRRDREILIQFNEYISTIVNGKSALRKFGGYMIKNFDIPFIYKRMLICGIYPNELFISWNKKPSELPHIDLYEVFNGGTGQHGMSGFGITCELLGVESPKQDGIDGTQVCYVYWNDHDMKKVSDYCDRDVKSSIKLALRLSGEKLLEIYENTLSEYLQSNEDTSLKLQEQTSI